MKTRLQVKEPRTDGKDEKIDQKILSALQRKNKYWSAKSLAKRYQMNIELMEHQLVEMAQRGIVSLGMDREGHLYVGVKE